MRIGIFGGTFNPPHIGHKRMALAALENAKLDKVLIMPTFTPPHKESPELESAEDRFNMCRELFREPIFEVSDLEINREGKSYTVDTVNELKELYPESELFLILGSDMLLSFQKWYKYQEILKNAKLIVSLREDDISPKIIEYYAHNLLKLNDESFLLTELPPFVCSSTEVREKLKNGENIREFLTDEVLNYIKKYDLYSPSYAEYNRLLRAQLDNYRYIHSINVARSAKKLAALYGEDEEKAYLAGLLHDVTKNTPYDVQLQIMEKDGIILSRVEKNNRKLWHAMSGASYIKNELGLTDEDFVGAVRYHTTGKSGMTLLQKIVYIADYISEERDYPDVEVMRSLALKSLEEAALYSLKYTIKKCEGSNLTIHTDSIDFYNELIIEMRKEKDDD